MAAESEYDKQKALMEQKMEFLERQLEESQRKEKELSGEVKSQKREHFGAVKELQGRLEQQIKDLQRRIEEQAEALFEWESRYQELESKHEQAVAKAEDSEGSKTKEVTKLREQLNETARNYDALKKKYAEDVEQLRLTQEEDSHSQSQRLRDLET
jgi:predicted RNase H-like nuclease (RuvC/YqgF family)